MTALHLGLLRGGLEIKQFLRSRESVVFTLAFPLLLLVLFGAIFEDELAPGVSYTQYFAAGMLAAGLLSTGFQSLAIQIPIEREKGILKRLRGTPMPRVAYFVGKVVMVLAIGLAETVLLLATAVLLFDLPLPSTAGKWLTFAWVGVLGITACTLCGIAFSSLARSGRSGPAVATPVAIVLQFISGIFIPYQNIPGWLRDIASVFPLKWMCQGMRSVFLPDSFAAQEVDGGWQHGTTALVLGAWIVGGLVLCLATFRWTDRS
ncbi:ABC transporter permease [Dactylosporangium roseum]|uniref:Transport permease protein n=1 Tax=Dactylosporangium roseum TaxID=47989 RepID=A0ABY5Z860_9ACTN|nr:ABC transporter permease [Dactylosporangium roseum]UWZ38042.1 ABC transporter permease [Dactylosporangium roseum]